MKQEIDRGKRHDLSAVDEGLIYLAMNYGKARKASRKMAEDGLTPIPPATLDYWKKVSHPGRYEQLRAEMEKRRDLNAAERMDALVSRALDIEEQVLEQTAETLDKIDARDLPNAFKNLAIGSGRPPSQERQPQGQAGRHDRAPLRRGRPRQTDSGEETATSPGPSGGGSVD
jgi:hypothetical protein